MPAVNLGLSLGSETRVSACRKYLPLLVVRVSSPGCRLPVWACLVHIRE